MVLSTFANFVTFAAAVAAATTSVEAKPRVGASVHRALREQATVNVVLTLAEDTAATLSSVQSANYSSRAERIASLVASLEKHAQETQSEVDSTLLQEAAGSEPLYTAAKSFWLTNQVYVQDASAELLTKLMELSSVGEIREERVFSIPAPLPAEEGGNASVVASNASTIGLDANEWGISIVDAPEVWDLGYTGEGVVVSSIDTGVLSTHEALIDNFRGDYGWYDPESQEATPYDVYGHGTHTMGIMVGSGGIGMAPGATWMSCKGCRYEGCYESELLTCAEFITCPTDTSGNNRDCSKAPDLVSNSWGGGQGDDFYSSAVDAWQAAGIVPLFSIGNDGPECGTAGSPGDYDNVISVGATTSVDGLAYYSSKGPSVTDLIKPELSAPGTSVRSAWCTSTTSYSTISGTSMACPHVAGAVALMLSVNSSLTYDDVTAALFASTDKTITSTGYTCDGTSDSTIPNNQFGYGRLNALAAVESL